MNTTGKVKIWFRSLTGADRIALVSASLDNGLPSLRVRHGDGGEETYFPTTTYSGGINWHRITPDYPRPFAHQDLWERLDQLLHEHFNRSVPNPIGGATYTAK